LPKDKPTVVLGIDGGGTKTEAVVLDVHGRVLSVGTGGPTNLAYVSQEIANKSVEDAVRQALEESSSGIADVALIGRCFVGGKPTKCIVSRLGYRGDTIAYEEGRVVFARAGIFGLRGVAVVAGTGSAFFAFDGAERSVRVGGWGPIAGEEGSGFDIGLRGIRAAARALDGRGPETLLLPRILEYYQVATIWDVLGRYCRPTIDQRGVASSAKVVTAAAIEGDEVAKEIVAAAAESLTSDIIFVAGRFFQPSDKFPVVLGGGVFAAGEIITGPVTTGVLAKFPKATVRLPQIGPGEAVARLALRHLQGGDANASD